jgi:hypothetical protein
MVNLVDRRLWTNILDTLGCRLSGRQVRVGFIQNRKKF